MVSNIIYNINIYILFRIHIPFLIETKINSSSTSIPKVLDSIKESKIEVNEENFHTISHIQFLSVKSNDNIKRPTVEKMGDWICFNCNNFNFSFRATCNKCKISKILNAKLGLSLEEK